MANLNNRTRVVYFRMSEDEFSKLCGLREAKGARSVSELARSAVDAMLRSQGDTGRENIAQRLDDLERSVSEMNHHLRTLTEARAESSVQRGTV